MQKIIGYCLILLGLVFIPSGIFMGLFLGAMSTDSGDTSYFWPIMLTCSFGGFLIAFIQIKVALKLVKK